MESILPVQWKRSLKAEVMIHLLFWVFIFSAVNVSWTDNWFDPDLRPITPAPLSVILFPVLFYAHAFWAFPRFFKQRKWGAYALSLFLIFLLPELIRVIVYSFFLDKSMIAELLSRDSFVFGVPSTVWMSFLLSTGYMITRDWFRIHSETQLTADPDSPEQGHQSPYNKQLLSTTEADVMMGKLGNLMDSDKAPYKNPNFTLRDAARALDTTDKKISALLNNHMNTGFSEYINRLRINAFLEGLKRGELDRLSITGFALQCGFSSKTSFYRAFKKETGCTPTEYLERHTIK
jgi:AraC-like DNA-binding protein